MPVSLIMIPPSWPARSSFNAISTSRSYVPSRHCSPIKLVARTNSPSSISIFTYARTVVFTCQFPCVATTDGSHHGIGRVWIRRGKERERERVGRDGKASSTVLSRIRSWAGSFGVRPGRLTQLGFITGSPASLAANICNT